MRYTREQRRQAAQEAWQANRFRVEAISAIDAMAYKTRAMRQNCLFNNQLNYGSIFGRHVPGSIFKTEHRPW